MNINTDRPTVENLVADSAKSQTILCVYLKRISSRVTNASSALGVLNDYALYKSTHSLTHSLIIYVYRGVRDPPEFGQNRLDVCG